MKKRILTSAVIAAASLALVPGSARATNVSTSAGDLILGFEASGSPDDLEVDIGPYTNYLNAASAFNVTFGVIPNTSTTVTNLNSDLGIFGSSGSWASNTSLLWGVVGAHLISGSKYDIFLTQDASNPTLPTNPTNGQSGTDSTQIKSVTSGLGNYSQDAYSTVAAAIPTGDANSWTSFNPNTTGFGTGYQVEQDFTPAVGSTLNLYELIPNTNGTGNATDLGSFTLDSGGDLTFTPASVPEPSTWASIIGGALFLGFFRRRGLRAS